MRLKVVFEAWDEGGYTVHVPALPGCISEGDTLSEARDNIAEAIALHLESFDEVGAPQAIPPGSLVEEITV